MLGDQDVGGGKNAPNYPDGVAIPEPERQPCLDEEHCEEEEQAKTHEEEAQNPSQNTAESPPDSPTDLYKQSGGGTTSAPTGTIKIPGKK